MPHATGTGQVVTTVAGYFFFCFFFGGGCEDKGLLVSLISLSFSPDWHLSIFKKKIYKSDDAGGKKLPTDWAELSV